MLVETVYVQLGHVDRGAPRRFTLGLRGRLRVTLAAPFPRGGLAANPISAGHPYDHEGSARSLP